METNEPPSAQPALAVIVKLGGAAITHKQAIKSLNQEVLEACAALLAALHRHLLSSTGAPDVGHAGNDAADVAGGARSARRDADRAGGASSTPARLVIVHGAGSFGHHTASRYGVARGGMASSAFVRRGFAETRASVTQLNHLVVSALLAAGVPAVGLSPCGAWTTKGRAVAADGCNSVAALLRVGLVPVLHGDAVLDDELGCTILSGDLIVSRLCERFRPPVVAFLTNVDGIFDRPPEQAEAQLISRLEVHAASVSPHPNSGDRGDDDSTARGSSKGSSSFTAFAGDGRAVGALETSAAAHDTTGGVATKIQEAAAVAKLGSEVRIARAGGPSAAAACSPAEVPPGWVGTLVVLRSGVDGEGAVAGGIGG